MSLWDKTPWGKAEIARRYNQDLQHDQMLEVLAEIRDALQDIGESLHNLSEDSHHRRMTQ